MNARPGAAGVGCDAGNRLAVGRDEQTEGWAADHGQAARTVRIDRVANRGDDVFQQDLAAEAASHDIVPRAVSIEDMKSSPRCQRRLWDRGRKQRSGVGEEISSLQRGQCAPLHALIAV